MFFYESHTAFFIVIASFAIAIAAQLRVKSAYNKYSKIKASTSMTGSDVARLIVKGTDTSVVLYDGGTMSDHFDPRTKTIALSPDVYNSNT
ncbi:zinc metallopeptidase, partial [Candidatus Gastranaerophilus sp. (ex Termes propinquus)]